LSRLSLRLLFLYTVSIFLWIMPQRWFAYNWHKRPTVELCHNSVGLNALPPIRNTEYGIYGIYTYIAYGIYGKADKPHSISIKVCYAKSLGSQETGGASWKAAPRRLPLIKEPTSGGYIEQSQSKSKLELSQHARI